jgi:hypothetical protein
MAMGTLRRVIWHCKWNEGKSVLNYSQKEKFPRGHKLYSISSFQMNVLHGISESLKWSQNDGWHCQSDHCRLLRLCTIYRKILWTVCFVGFNVINHLKLIFHYGINVSSAIF